MVELHVGEWDVADHGVERRKFRVAEVLDTDVGVRMARPGDPAGYAVQFDADKTHPFRGVAHEIADAAARFQDRGLGGDAKASDASVDRLHDSRRRVEGVE